jgi:hypothetical protein
MAKDNSASFEEFDNKNGDSPEPENDNQADDLTEAPVPKGRGENATLHPVRGNAVEDGVRNVTQLMTDDAKRIKEILAAQPKVDFYIPLSAKEKLGQAYETVTINGYRLEIKKGMMVKVPKQVADMLAEFLNIQTSAGVELRVENKSEETQKALS